MRAWMLAGIAVVLLAGCGGEATKDDPAAYTQQFVQQAIDRYESEGREATIAYYNTAASTDGAWYVAVMSTTEVLALPPVLGDYSESVPGSYVDTAGYPVGALVVTATERGRWIVHHGINIETGEGDTRHAWIVRHDGLLFVSGWYEPDAPPLPVIDRCE